MKSFITTSAVVAARLSPLFIADLVATNAPQLIPAFAAVFITLVTIGFIATAKRGN